MIDQPLATRAPAPLRLRKLTPEDAPALARHAAADAEHLREHDMDGLSLVGAELDAAVTPRA